MKTHAGRHAPKSARRLRENRRRPSAAPPGRKLSDRESLLDHLEESPDALSEGWARATTDPVALPHREELERKFGRPLDHVHAYAGPDARSLLDALGAVGATRGQEILLTSEDAPIETVAHEVAHALQGSAVSTEDYPGVLPESHQAETAAATSAQEALDGKGAAEQPKIAALNDGWVALLRRSGEELPDTGLDDPETPTDVAVDDPPATDEVEDAEEEPPPPPSGAGRSVRGGAAARAAPAPETQEAETAVETAPEARRETETEAAAERLAPGPDRQQEIREVLDSGQQTWDTASERAGNHEATVCPCSAIEEGQHPFVRGPPLDVPAVNPDTPAAPVEPEQVDEEHIIREADDAATRQLGRGPPRGDSSAALEAEQAEEVRELAQEIGNEAPPEVPETPELSLTGESDPQLIANRGQQLDIEVDASAATAQLASREDFGEALLAPGEDPTRGHDESLDGLDVPAVDLHELLPADTLDRVATDANVGSLPLDQVLVARDEDMQQCRETTALQAETRQSVAQHLSDSESALSEMCARSCGQSDGLLQEARTGVDGRRTEWQQELDDHVEMRRGEGETLVRERQDHIDQVGRDTSERAGRRMSTARTEADRRWRDAGTRAVNKTKEGNDPSWWERGIAWFRRQLDRLRSWIHDFIEGCRRAIHAFLEASRDAAHAIVDAGHRAITGTIELTRHGLDVLANNLPGELGAIARGWRDDAHAFLDGVQSRVDDVAEDLHESIDDEIDDLIERVDHTLDALEEGLEGAFTLLDEALEAGPVMVILRRLFPDLARLVESGLDTVTQWAADGINGWLDSVVSLIGLDNLTAWLEDLHNSSICGPQGAESAAEACDAFEGLLQNATGWLDSILASPAAQSVQEWLQEGRDEAAEQQVDQLGNFLDFVHAFVAPIYQAWEAIESAASSVMEVLGDVGRTVWRHVAEFLGIDPDIDPIQALRNGIQALWDGIVAAAQPLVHGIREAWRWIRDESPLAWFIDFIASLPEAWHQLTDLVGRIGDGIGAAMAAAADFFTTTLFPALEGALQAVGGFLHGLIDKASVFIDGIFATFQQLLSWESGIALLDALVRVVQTIFTPIVAACRVMQDCVLAFWHSVADGIGHLLHWIRVFFDISVGIVVALSFPPISIFAFFAGTVWLYLVPECCKAPIINFFLDVCIRLLRFLPEPADFMWAALYNGTLAFLETLREPENDEQKVRAMNLFASIFAGNVEVAAGFLVGLLAGVWESTGGTLIFLVQAVAWLISLPFKLGQWVVGLATGTTEEEGIAPRGEAGGAEEPAAETGAAGEVVDEDSAPLGRSVDPPGLRAVEERPAGEPVREAESLPSDGTTSEGASGASSRADQSRSPEPVEEAEPSATAEDAQRQRPEPDDEAARAEEREGALGPDTDEEEASEESEGEETAEDFDEAEPGVEEEEEIGDEEPAAARAEGPPSVRGPPPAPGLAAASAAERLPSETSGTPAGRPVAPAAVRELPPPEATPAPAAEEGADIETDPQTAAVDDLDAVPGEEAGESGTEDEVAWPELPDLEQIGDFFRQLATEGFSREDARNMLDGIRGGSRALVQSLAQSAAHSMLEFLSNPASPYRIGVVLGTIAGMLVVEVALAYFTAGASTAVTAAKAALTASRGVARLASVVARLRRALQPLFELVSRLRRAAQGLMSKVMGWLDNIVQWMNRMLRRFLGRAHAPRPPVRPPRVPGPRPHGPRAPPRGPRPPRRPGQPRRPGRPGGRRPGGSRRGGGPRQPGRLERPGGRRPGRGRRPGQRGHGRGRGRDGRRRQRDRDRSRGGIRGRVRLAANAGWRAVQALARTRVVRRRQALQTARRGARTVAAGISIRVNTRHLGSRMWTLRVTGRRGRKRATVSRGRAWFGRDERRQPWYSAARDQTSVHRRVVRNADRRLEAECTRLQRRTISPIEIHHRLKPAIRRVESSPRPHLLHGVHLRIDERILDREGDERRRTALVYPYTLAPNTTRARVTISTASPPAVKYHPTTDLGHALLALAVPRRIANLGPYRLLPRGWDRMPWLPNHAPSWEFRPSAGWLQSHERQWQACFDATTYEPEEYEFDAPPGHARFQHVGPVARTRLPNQTLIANRVDAARRRVIGAAPPTIFDALTAAAYGNGDFPRPMTGLRDEEQRGGHTVSRHVIIREGDVRTPRELALRAAFSRVPRLHRPLRLDPLHGALPGAGRDAGTASAWNSLDDANDEANRIDNELRGDWARHRLSIVGGRNVELRFRRRVAIVAYRSRNAGAAPWPAAELPAYLNMGPGLRPVSQEDLTSNAWIVWLRRARRQGQIPNPSPLTQDASGRGSRVFVRIVADAGAPGGWYVNSMFPIW